MRYTALHCLPKPGRILHPSHWRCEQKNLRPLESIAETQPQFQPALLRFSAMISQLRFTPHNCISFALHTERSLRRIGWKYHALIIRPPFTAASRPKAIC
jgi:hypothetical protein